jgi:hypothetical protein
MILNKKGEIKVEQEDWSWETWRLGLGVAVAGPVVCTSTC